MASRRQSAVRGTGLASVLFFVTAACLVVFTLAATSVVQLGVAARLEHESEAERLAESLIATAIQKLMADSVWGAARLPGQTLTMPGRISDSRARLTFNMALTEKVGAPLSTNAIHSVVSTVGYRNRVVPRNTAHLVAAAESGTLQRTIECIVHLPPYPYALATSNTIEVAGGFQVAGVPSQCTAGMGTTIPRERLTKADILSNASSGPAIHLSGGSEVLGDVISAGKVRIDGGARVDGDVLEDEKPITLPKIDVTQYDPQRRSPTPMVPLPPIIVNPESEGDNRAVGVLQVMGPLKLRGTLLYVDGDLVVNGPVRGKGAIIATGNILLQGDASLTADDVAAVLCRGNLTILGHTQNRFQGMMYTEGNFVATRCTLFGAFVANGPPSTVTRITNSTLISVPDYAHITVDAPLPPGVEVTWVPISITQKTAANADDASGADILKEIQFGTGGLDDPVYFHIPVFFYKRPDGGTAFAVGRYLDLTLDQAVVYVMYFAVQRAKGITQLSAIDTADWVDAGSDAQKRGLRDQLSNAIYRAGFMPPVLKWEPKVLFDLNLSQFLKNEDRMRLLLWQRVD